MLGLGLNLGLANKNTIISEDFTPVTDGMTLDATWDIRGQTYTDLSGLGTEIGSVKVISNFGSTDEGILLEAGGASTGILLYVFNGFLYFRCGDAGPPSDGSGINTSSVSWEIPSGAKDYTVEFSYNNTNAALYVNGDLIGTNTRNSTTATGANPGTIGEIEQSGPTNLGGWTGDEAGPFTGTVTKAEIFLGELTADV